MIKQIVMAHGLLVFGLSVALLLFGAGGSVSFSFLLGGFLMNLNLAVLTQAWSMIIRKKLIALAVSIIVIKYAIIAGVVYSSLNEAWFHALSFGAGIASLMVVLTGSMFFLRKAYVV